MRNLSGIAAVVGGLVLLAVLGVLGYVVAPYIFGGAGTESRTALLEKISAEINRDLPTKVDEGTRLDSTSVDDETLEYNYSLLPPLASRIDRETFVSDYETAVQQAICSKARLRGLLKRKFKIAYRYRLDGGDTLGRIVVARADCTS